MTYETLGGGGLDLSLSMESKSNSLPLMMSAGAFGGIFKGFRGRIFEHPEVKTANIAIWREKSRFLWR